MVIEDFRNFKKDDEFLVKLETKTIMFQIQKTERSAALDSWDRTNCGNINFHVLIQYDGMDVFALTTIGFFKKISVYSLQLRSTYLFL